MPDQTSPKRWIWPRILVVGLITLLAAFFRLYRIDTLPPGDGYDPAYYGVDALQFLHGERLPIMLQPNREVLFSYVVATSFLLVGASTLGIHLASALVGLATIPVGYMVGEALFTNVVDEENALKRWGGLVAALMMAISYWHLNWSRYGVRAILVPLFATLTFAFLWQGLHKSNRWAFALCGISLGLSMYTYQAARLLPVLVVGAFAAVVWRRGSIMRRDWINFLIVTLMALIVFAPLGIYFVEHPGSFTMRVKDALVVHEEQDMAGKSQAILDQTVKTLLSFSFVGDNTPYSTIPGRPSLNPFLSVLFLLGIAISLAHIQRPAYVFLLAWLVVMTIPATLAGRGPVAKRAIGALPAVALLIAVGVLEPAVLLQRRIGRRLARWLSITWALIIASGFIYTGITTYHDYFVTWGSNPNLFTHFEVGISAIGDYIGTLPPEERIYVSPDLPTHPAIWFHSNLREDVRGYNGRVCMVLPSVTPSETTYIVTPSKDKHGLASLQRHFPQGHIVYDGAMHYGEPYFRAYRVPPHSTAFITPSQRVSIAWEPYIQILGYDQQGECHPGDVIELTIYYQATAPMEKDYTAFVHLLSANDPASNVVLWAQHDKEPCHTFYSTSTWQVSEIIKDTFTLALSPDMPSGTYALKTGFYDLQTMERLSVTRGEAQDNAALLSTLQIEK